MSPKLMETQAQYLTWILWEQYSVQTKCVFWVAITMAQICLDQSQGLIVGWDLTSSYLKDLKTVQLKVTMVIYSNGIYISCNENRACNDI